MPVAGLRWDIKVARGLSQHLFQDCFVPTAQAWDVGGLWGTVSSDPAKGTFDPIARSGSVLGRSKALLFDSLSQKLQHSGHAWRIDNVGLQVKNGRGVISAQIRSARTLFTAARRQTIAAIARPKVAYGVGHSFSRRGTDLGPLPNSFVMSLSGKATITKAFAAATRRWRCKGRAANGQGPHVRSGEPLGSVIVAFGATTATGLGGEVALARAEFFDNDEGNPIAVTAVAPAGKKRVADATGLRFPISSGAGVPLRCNLGTGCSPLGGGLSLDGGFTLTFNGRSTTIGGLAVAWQLGSDGFLRQTLTGTVDGQPITIATGSDPSPTDEFIARIGQALGTTVDARIAGLDPQFTSTGPAQ
jgi:hypothetical protein